jgi:hypothetical protein
MFRRPPSASAIALGTIVIGLFAAAATFAWPANVWIAAVLFGGSVLLTIGLIAWHVIGSRRDGAAKRKALMAELEIQRKIIEAMSAPRVPAGIRTGRGHNVFRDVHVAGFPQAIDAENADSLEMNNVTARGPNQATPRSPRKSKRDPKSPPPSQAS